MLLAALPQGGTPLPFEDRAGFQQIFDGVSLKDWDGDPTSARRGGALVGESTPKRQSRRIPLVMWQGGEPK